jgi:hypothetical protein
MFDSWYNANHECARLHLWIAGRVAAVGMRVAFWGARRGRLLAVFTSRLLVAGLIALSAFTYSDGGAGLGSEGWHVRIPKHRPFSHRGQHQGFGWDVVQLSETTMVRQSDRQQHSQWILLAGRVLETGS